MITTSSLIKKALYFSAEKHNGQYRKGGSVPYIVHPVLVAWGVWEYTKDEEIIAAALLHDTLEDCPEVTMELLQNEFGERIAGLVKEVSFLDGDKKTLPSWRARKEYYLKKLSNISSDALLIVAADKMANMHGYFEALKSGIDVSKLSFGGTPDDYRWYYGEVASILEMASSDTLITKDYQAMYNFYMQK